MTAEEKNIAMPITAIKTANKVSTASLAEGFKIENLHPDLIVKTYHRLPDGDPIYALVGQIASDWALLEHALDVIIWDLAELQPKAGACLTAQMMGHASRCDAIVALASYWGLAKDTIAQVETLKNKLFEVSGPRNRIVHDPWVTIATSDSDSTVQESGQYKSMARRELKFGAEPVGLDEIKSIIAKIQHKRNDCYVLMEKISEEMKALRGK